MLACRLCVAVIALLLCLPVPAAEQFSYESVAERYSATKLADNQVQEAQMHGECLVGLKNLIFVKRNKFDPVAEWINYRAFSLLEQFPPCYVLIMMEVAREELMREEDQSSP